VTSSLTRAILVVLALSTVEGLALSNVEGLAAGAAAAQAPAADLKTSISRLSAFDYPTRTSAARALRRLAAADVVPALTEAARSHQDQFVRARALVLLTAFRDPGTSALMESLLRDRNDRIREVVYRWFEEHPEPRLVPTLLTALETEQAEFVRPALIRALAAHDEYMAVQRALLGETARGLDFFRSAVIETLGEHRATYAVEALTRITAIDGPLQDDAILALGRIGDRSSRATLTGLSALPADVVPVRHAALCMLQDDCPSQIAALVATLKNPTAAPAVARASVAALGAIAESGNETAIATLFTLAGQSTGRTRDEVAIAFASAAMRRPEQIVAWIDKLPEANRAAAIDMLRSGFESLEEDYAEEQFFANVRAAYWAAAEGSTTRTVAAALIDRLEF
jgi:HEAT repeat protein